MGLGKVLLKNTSPPELDLSVEVTRQLHLHEDPAAGESHQETPESNELERWGICISLDFCQTLFMCPRLRDLLKWKLCELTTQ